MSVSPIYFRIVNHNTAETRNPAERAIADCCSRMTMRVINPVKSDTLSIKDIETILTTKDSRMKQLTQKDIEAFLNVEDASKKVEQVIIILETKYKKIISWIPRHAIDTYVDSSGNSDLQEWMKLIFICKDGPIIHHLDVKKLFEKVTDEMTEAWLIKKILISKVQNTIVALMNMGKLRTYLNIVNADRVKDILSSHHIPAIELLTQGHWNELLIKAPKYFLPLETVRAIPDSFIAQIPSVICQNTYLHHLHLKGKKDPWILRKQQLLHQRYLNEETKNTVCSEKQNLLPATEIDTMVATPSVSKIKDSHASFFARPSTVVNVQRSDKDLRIRFKIPLTLLPHDENGPTLFNKRPLSPEPACQISPISEPSAKKLKHS